MLRWSFSARPQSLFKIPIRKEFAAIHQDRSGQRFRIIYPLTFSGDAYGSTPTVLRYTPTSVVWDLDLDGSFELFFYHPAWLPKCMEKIKGIPT